MIASRFALRAALPGLLLACTFPTLASATEATPADAASGSGGLTSAASSTEAAPTPAVTPAPASPTEAALPGAGVWTVPRTGTTTRPLRITGAFDAKLAGRAVRLQRKTPANRWKTVATSRVRTAGAFAVSWRTRAARNHDLRLQLLAPGRSGHTAVSAAGRTAASSSSALRVAVVGETRASWFGPGFYGRKTACGLRLTTATEGVAHRTLPCGTQVEIRLGGKTAVVPVIDRGPFANHADFDLTKSVADRVGLTGVSTVQWVERADLPRVATPYRAPALRG